MPTVPRPERSARRGRRRLAAVLVLLGLGALAPLAAQSVTREQLPNGLTLIVDTRSESHAVVARVDVAAGPLYEGELLGSGASALVARVVEAAAAEGRLDAPSVVGSGLRAELAVDATSFTLATTDAHVVPALALLGAAVAYRVDDDAQWERARAAQLRARERVLTAADELAGERLAFTALRRHPARLPLSGRAEQLAQLDLSRARAYHARRYSAPRCTVVVVGNVDPAAVRAAVLAAFARVPVHGWEADRRVLEPPQYAERVARVAGPVAQERHHHAWRSVPFEHRDQAVLAVVAELLHGDPRAALQRALVGGQLATDLHVVNRSAPEEPGRFEIAYTPFPGRAAEAWLALQGELDRLARSGPDAARLAEAKRAVLRRHLARARSTAGAARALAEWERAIAVPDYAEVVRGLIAATTAEDVRRVVAEHLDPGGRNRSRLIMLPRQSHEDPPAVAPGPTLSDVPPRLVEDLGSGARGLLRRMPLGLVHLRATLGGGAAADAPGHAGTSAVLARVLGEGHRELAGADFRAYLAERGMALEVAVDRHLLEIGLTCFPEDLDAGLELLVDLVRRPALPDEAIVRAVLELQAERSYESGQPEAAALLERAVHRQLLGEHYAATGLTGTRETLAGIDRSILLDHHDRLAVGENLVFSVYGECDLDAAVTRLRALLAREPVLPHGEAWQPVGLPWAEAAQPGLATITWDRPASSAVALAWRGPSLAEQGRFGAAVDLIHALALGSDGLVASGLDRAELAIADLQLAQHPYAARGLWVASAAVQRAEVEAAAETLRARFAALAERLTLPADDPAAVATAQLERAQQRCIARRVLITEDQVAAQRLHARALLVHGGVEHAHAYRRRIEAVTREELALAAATWLAAPPTVVRLVPSSVTASPTPGAGGAGEAGQAPTGGQAAPEAPTDRGAEGASE